MTISILATGKLTGEPETKTSQRTLAKPIREQSHAIPRPKQTRPVRYSRSIQRPRDNRLVA